MYFRRSLLELSGAYQRSDLLLEQIPTMYHVPLVTITEKKKGSNTKLVTYTAALEIYSNCHMMNNLIENKLFTYFNILDGLL